ncbi:MAG TPA: WhiB family transcriptional regulator [Candidatus Saccharimonadales bacterium]|nr:WhiB family transcriptional regulator [Candidatus Saccharimonadales bacterium]
MPEMIGEGWQRFAVCANGDPDAMFVSGALQHEVVRFCNGCLAKTDCLAEALDNREEFGVWGGMTERERRALLRRHPNVPSWRQMFMASLAVEGTARDL